MVIMFKKLTLFFAFFSFVFFSLYIFVAAEEKTGEKIQEIKIESKKIEYQLPYPGILPDHPLYFLKVARDRILDFLTRDHLKKTELYLLFSDKRINMALLLSKKGLWKLMISTASKGEKYALKMTEVLRTAKKQGEAAGNDFLLKAKLSNEKHREILENLLKETPQGERQELKNVLELNKQIKEKLNTL
jgi:hypothetical protein